MAWRYGPHFDQNDNTGRDTKKRGWLKTKITKLFIHSNLGFALLGQVLGERFGAIGGGFEGWMRDNLLSTLGMKDTTFNLDAR